jgi:2-dehydropantoate 2-reductase
MRIGVIGLGAIGGVVAARLLRSGLEVALAAGRSAGAIGERGLRVRGESDVRPSLVSAALPEGRYDLLLLCTRTGDTAKALAPAVPMLAPEGAVVCLQNGLPEEKAAALAGAGRVLGAVIGWSASAEGPGSYLVTGGGKFTLGGSSPRLADARDALARAFPVKVTDNLAGARWSKLALNCAISTLGAVSGLSLGELAARREVRALGLAVVAEVVAAAHSRGVRLERVSGLRPDKLVRWPLALQHTAFWLSARRRPRQRSGMIARLREGRSAGVEDLNELIDGPVNRKLCALVHAIERGEKQIDPRHLEALA